MGKVRTMLQGGLAALLLLGNTLPAHIPSYSRQPVTQEERILSEKKLFASEKPIIYGMRVHHLHDLNKDGLYFTGEGLTQVFSETSGKRLQIKEPIPGDGTLGVYVPQQFYWGKKVIAKFTDLTRGYDYVIDQKEVLDLTGVNSTNSYDGKPQECVIVPLEKYKRQLEQLLAPNKPEVYTYHLLIIAEDGSESHSLLFKADYSKSSDILEAKKGK